MPIPRLPHFGNILKTRIPQGLPIPSSEVAPRHQPPDCDFIGNA
jgi:hypothetical protein